MVAEGAEQRRISQECRELMGFSLKTKAGSFPLQPGRSETLAVPYSTALNCAVSVEAAAGKAAGRTRVVYPALLF